MAYLGEENERGEWSKTPEHGDWGIGYDKSDGLQVLACTDITNQPMGWIHQQQDGKVWTFAPLAEVLAWAAANQLEMVRKALHDEGYHVS